MYKIFQNSGNCPSSFDFFLHQNHSWLNGFISFLVVLLVTWPCSFLVINAGSNIHFAVTPQLHCCPTFGMSLHSLHALIYVPKIFPVWFITHPHQNTKLEVEFLLKCLCLLIKLWCAQCIKSDFFFKSLQSNAFAST